MKVLERHGENILNLELQLFRQTYHISETYPQFLSAIVEVTYDLLVLSFSDEDSNIN